MQQMQMSNTLMQYGFKRIKFLFLLGLAIVTLYGCEPKIEHAKTETFKVWGNCNMCKKTIEKAAYEKGKSKGEWNKVDKVVVITYDTLLTNTDVILKRVAGAGYDNEKYTSTDEAYAKRPDCCHYKRK